MASLFRKNVVGTATGVLRIADMLDPRRAMQACPLDEQMVRSERPAQSGLMAQRSRDHNHRHHSPLVGHRTRPVSGKPAEVRGQPHQRRRPGRNAGLLHESGHPTGPAFDLDLITRLGRLGRNLRDLIDIVTTNATNARPTRCSRPTRDRLMTIPFAGTTQPSPRTRGLLVPAPATPWPTPFPPARGCQRPPPGGSRFAVRGADIPPHREP